MTVTHGILIALWIHKGDEDAAAEWVCGAADAIADAAVVMPQLKRI